MLFMALKLVLSYRNPWPRKCGITSTTQYDTMSISLKNVFLVMAAFSNVSRKNVSLIMTLRFNNVTPLIIFMASEKLLCYIGLRGKSTACNLTQETNLKIIPFFIFHSNLNIIGYEGNTICLKPW